MILLTEDLRDRIIDTYVAYAPMNRPFAIRELAELRAAPLFVAPSPATPETFEAVRKELEVRG